MKVNTRKAAAKKGDPLAHAASIIDEERRPARLPDQRVDTVASDGQHAVLAAVARRDRTHRLAHATSSRFRASRSSLPLGPRGRASRQRMTEGCMKLGSSRLR